MSKLEICPGCGAPWVSEVYAYDCGSAYHASDAILHVTERCYLAQITRLQAVVDKFQSMLDGDPHALFLRTAIRPQIGWRVERASVGWTQFDGPFSTKALADESREAAEALAQGAAKEAT